MTTLAISTQDLSTLAVDAIVVGVMTGKPDRVEETTTAKDNTGNNSAPRAGLEFGAGAARLDAALQGHLAQTLQQLGATGAANEVTTFATFGAITAPVIAAVGLGKFDDQINSETIRKAAGAAVRGLAGSEQVAIALAVDDPGLLQPIAEGALLGSYDFTEFKTVGDTYKPPVPAITLLTTPAAKQQAHATARRASVLCLATTLARNWINTPANHLRPAQFAEIAAQRASEAGLDVEVLDEKALREQGFGGLLAVGSGSDAPPRLVRISYQHPNAATRIALVGKGITFDSGGVSIKPAEGMQQMKSDMSGAAVVIATMLAIAQLKPSISVTTYVPMAENMPSGSAYRPGDVITLYGGKRVEILNTDAEGRLIVGDAIVRACDENPDYLVEVSTLTGGQVTALGRRVTGVMGTPDLCDRVKQAGERSGEPMWPMPLPEDVKAGMTSPVADLSQINHSFDRAGHMLQGGAFLAKCVSDGVSWAHLDIAGPAYNPGDAYGYIAKGGTGVPLRTLIEVLDDLAQSR